ncbi:hypothetical protein A2U01_0075170, partial [Trifolium medium]|nr:hypothetical protein [Trifolium medium]
MKSSSINDTPICNNFKKTNQTMVHSHPR